MENKLYKCMTLLCIFIVAETYVSAKEARDVGRQFLEQFVRYDGATPEHPFIFFVKSEVFTLQQKATTTHKKIAKNINDAGKALLNTPYLMPPESEEKFASRWNEIYGNNLCAFAMYCVINPRDEAAFKLVMTYMDRMANYSNWYVASSKDKDEVPIGHSLSGFATAYDFLYLRMNRKRRDLYLKKIKVETEGLYKVIEKNRAGWTRQYIHNHAPTNLLAMLLGAMVCKNHNIKEAAVWISAAREHFDKAMVLLSNVIDGSLDEGVAYGSYTARGLTQYIFIAKKHFGVDHTSNPWLKEHFWFYFSTILPGYQRSVGIADANHNWFYGPESQLVFLDKFVMRNGYGNWLADQIRKNKPKERPLGPSTSQIWSVVHTEYIFYDETLGSVEPKYPMNSKLHLFSDWGVATYGAGLPQKPGNTFLSFKSGSLNGEAVKDIIENKLYVTWVEGWRNFNAGHEHPDQNSFVFAPNGRYVITEALYSPKYTYLNNVLQFSPSKTSECNQPWEGQIGECYKWLKYNQIPIPRGEILAASESGGMVYMAGESVDAYSSSLKLQSVFRSLLLINPEVLVVVDSVKLEPESGVKKISAMFLNSMFPFKPSKSLGYNGAKVKHEEGSYEMFWFSNDGQSPIGAIKLLDYGSEYGVRVANSVNVTFSANSRSIILAYIFSGPKYHVDSAWFHNTNEVQCGLSVIVNGLEHQIKIAETTRAFNSKNSVIEQRKVATSFGGFARVKVNDETHYFGVGTSTRNFKKESISKNVNNEINSNMLFAKEVTDLLPIRKVLSGQADNRGDDFTFSAQVKTKCNPNESNFYLNLLTSLSFLTVLIIVFVVWTKRRRLRFSINLRHYGIYAIILTSLWMFMGYSYFYLETRNCDPTTIKFAESRDAISLINYTQPTVIITGLPNSGLENLDVVFDNHTELLYVPVDEKGIGIPVDWKDPGKLDLLQWEENANQITKGWFLILEKMTKLHFNNLKLTDEVRKIKQRVRTNLSLMKVVNLITGFWTSKMSWISKIIDQGKIKIIFVVKDPRDWIRELKYPCANDKKVASTSDFNNLVQVYDDLENAKVTLHEKIPEEYFTIKNSFKDQRLSSVEKLAALWTINTLSSLRQTAETLPLYKIQILKFEDLMSHPERTTREIFSRLGMTVSAPKINRVIRFTKKSEILHSLSDIGKQKLTCRHLLASEIIDIEEIAGGVMSLLNYKLNT